MEIEIGKFYMNKTRRFLYPCLKGHGDLFVLKFNKTFKLAVGIHDQNMADTFSYEAYKIYILLDSGYNKNNFESFMKWVRLEPYYVYDYCFSSDFKYTRKHMLIIKVPEAFYHAYETFLHGRYSLMYTIDQKLSFFCKKDQEKDYKILCNSYDARKEMIKKIQEEFEESSIENYLSYKSLLESELPLKNKEEIFNFSGSKLFFENENTILCQQKIVNKN